MGQLRPFLRRHSAQQRLHAALTCGCARPQAKANEKKYTGVSSDEARFSSFGGRSGGASGPGLGGAGRLGGSGGGGGWGSAGGRYDDDDDELELDKVRGLAPPQDASCRLIASKGQ